jgi:hypothetical protein
MNFPVNYSFVTTKKLTITEDDGAEKELSVLVLDEQANTAYWTKISSINETIQKVIKDGFLDKINHWVMSTPFIDMAVLDMIQESEQRTGVKETLTGCKYLINDDPEPVCFLQLLDGTTIINDSWK